MKINTIQSNSFKGYLVNGVTSETADYYRSRMADKQAKIKRQQELQERYMQQLNDLMQNYQSVLEFDSFMRSEEVKEIINRMPHNIDIRELIYSNSKDDNSTLALFSEEASKIKDRKGREIAYYSYCQNDDKSINKKGILSWLNNLVDYFNTTGRR